MGAKKELTSKRRRRTSAGCLGSLEVWILAHPPRCSWGLCMVHDDFVLFGFNRINPTPSLTWDSVWKVHSHMQTMDLKSGPAGG